MLSFLEFFIDNIQVILYFFSTVLLNAYKEQISDCIFILMFSSFGSSLMINQVRAGRFAVIEAWPYF
ncbi:hypothetical protein I7I53_07982 [Histoplasma capsulatum var. duboisii H88]|uniref:Uncharacterized protein n=1 Tax=Ajellomyces capsulatus (strain H88) TaxID=544711 RepID=A0A8A1LKJ7_AJEC8|nr:hypothetical protein I7I53_07982 [Histoplasma capsulatum var. duboisii H88]